MKMDTALQRKSEMKAGCIKNRIEGYWTRRADSFMIQREEELKSVQHRIWAEELLSHLNGRTGLNILDVGCGCGFFSMILAENGHHVTGIDLTESMIEKAGKLAEKYGTVVKFMQMDAENPDFPDESFDVIVSRNLTWTLPHPLEAYRQWMRVLKKGGILLNYDAEHARYHLRGGLEREEAHKMLSRRQMDECMNIYSMLPVSTWRRPEWDVFCLKQLGYREVSADRKIGKRLFPDENQFCTPYPVFCVKAVKK